MTAPTAILLHVEWFDYAERLLADGALDWSSPEAVAGMVGRAQALLPSDLIVLPLDRTIAAYLARDAVLRAAVAAKARDSQPVRAVLRDDGLRALLVDLVAQVAAAAGRATIAIALPAPDKLPGRIAAATDLPVPGIDEDLVDDVAVYSADFLRCFAPSPIRMLVLEGGDPGFAALAAPVLRVAAHYGWMPAVRDPDGAITGIVGQAPLPGIHTHRVPVDARPEDVRAAITAMTAPTTQ